jgi:hypothetical protein
VIGGGAYHLLLVGAPGEHRNEVQPTGDAANRQTGVGAPAAAGNVRTFASGVRDEPLRQGFLGLAAVREVLEAVGEG